MIVHFHLRGTGCDSRRIERILSVKIWEIKKQNPYLSIESIADYVATEVQALKVSVNRAESFNAINEEIAWYSNANDDSFGSVKKNMIDWQVADIE